MRAPYFATCYTKNPAREKWEIEMLQPHCLLRYLAQGFRVKIRGLGLKANAFSPKA